MRRAVWRALYAEPFGRCFESGRVRPVIDSSFPLERAADAQRRMESGAHVGKIVLTVGGWR